MDKNIRLEAIRNAVAKVEKQYKRTDLTQQLEDGTDLNNQYHDINYEHEFALSKLELISLVADL